MITRADRHLIALCRQTGHKKLRARALAVPDDQIAAAIGQHRGNIPSGRVEFPVFQKDGRLRKSAIRFADRNHTQTIQVFSPLSQHILDHRPDLAKIHPAHVIGFQFAHHLAHVAD